MSDLEERVSALEAAFASLAGAKPLPVGATTDAPADPGLLRERGLVAGFVRSGGKEWRGVGPSPFEADCAVRAEVLAEFEGRIAAVRAAREEDLALGGGVR